MKNCNKINALLCMYFTRCQKQKSAGVSSVVNSGRFGKLVGRYKSTQTLTTRHLIHLLNGLFLSTGLIFSKNGISKNITQYKRQSLNFCLLP